MGYKAGEIPAEFPTDKTKADPDPWRWIPTSFNISTLSMEVMLRTDDAIFLRLPRELWRSCGPCICNNCKCAEGYWDTLAISTKKRPGTNDFSWTVHMPEVPHFSSSVLTPTPPK